MSEESLRFILADRSREGLKLARESNNPLYIWETLEEFATWPGSWSAGTAKAWKDPHARTELPNWVLWHLYRVAKAFAAMGRGHALDSKEDPESVPAVGDETIAPAAALSEALHVLGLAHPGWNAFAAMRRDRLRENAAACLYYEMEPAVVQRYLGVKTARSLRRELAKLRR
jgi:hypothetical protein